MPTMLAASAAAASIAGPFAPNEALVKFRENTPLYSAAAALGSQGTVLETLPGLGVSRIRTPRQVPLGRTLAYFRSLPYVEFAEPNYVVKALDTPNDPLLPQQWHLARISAESAWDITHGSASIIIAVVDTGVDLAHPDLQGKLVPGYDFQNEDPNPSDDHGHGTHVSGIAAAATNNAIGVAGLGWDCRIMPIKSLDSDGEGLISDIALGINFAVANGAKVVSLSLGSTDASATLKTAVDQAWNSGVIVVAAAGNDNSNMTFYPAGFQNSIAVAATDFNDLRAGFSNYGPWVDVAAPGVEIRSTYPGSQYRIMSGTSMATPQVAGLAGLLLAHLGVATDPLTIRQRIEDTTVPVGSWLAHGRIDARAALTAFDNAVYRTTLLEAASVPVGQVVSGNLASLLESDNNRLIVAAARIGRSRAVEVAGYGVPAWAGEKLALQVAVESSASPKSTFTAYLWNFDLSRWDSIGTGAAGAADHRFIFQTANPEPFLDVDGGVELRIFRNEPRNRYFCIRVDKVELISVSSE